MYKAVLHLSDNRSIPSSQKKSRMLTMKLIVAVLLLTAPVTTTAFAPASLQHSNGGVKTRPGQLSNPLVDGTVSCASSTTQLYATLNGASSKKVIVLGGDGFCGWPTSLYLSDQGHDVIIVDNLSRRNIDIELGCDSLTPISSPEVSAI